ncbi:MAG: CbiX/SirB N-terminal domain-containing protein [Verrucomicrobiota bacterium]
MCTDVMEEFSDAALVLVGHGSTLNADSSRPTHVQADALRKRGIFAQVVTAFWKEHPMLAGALRQVFAPRVFVVPLFISEGYFTEEVIPRELGLLSPGSKTVCRVLHRSRLRIHYCGPVGTHPSMTSVILSRVDDVLNRFTEPGARIPDPRDISLFVAGHGTGLNENSRRAIEDHVDRLRAMNRFACVHPLFMEEEPRIGDCHRLATTPDRVVVPFFISDGLHSYEDIPVMLGAPEAEVRERFRSGQPTWINPTHLHGGRIWYTPGIGLDPQLSDVILERVGEAARQAAEQDDLPKK